MDSEIVVNGAIVDSWVEPAGARTRSASRLVLQVAPRGCPRELMIVEASALLVPDQGWFEDLRSNLCHGNSVAVVGRLSELGWLNATALEIGLDV